MCVMVENCAMRLINPNHFVLQSSGVQLRHAVVVSVAAEFSHSGAQTFHQQTLSRVASSTQV